MTDTTTRNFINPSTIAAPSGYTHVVETSGGRTIYLSGQVGFSPDGHVVGHGDTRSQAEQAFANLAAGLEAVGGSFRDVVKLTIFVIDMAEFGAVREVRDTFVDTSQPPASSAVQVSGFVFDWIRVEIEAVAVIAG
ncbi:RidA family protein [Cryobacterium sp. BB736]|uniref:RidA family protein n=1 Tax=Cryobacterium sp. BB736 TaxID=2746963 RepID=UPI00187534A2|nr:RidA family protein [Cryobacterium sp. BB736]